MDFETETKGRFSGIAALLGPFQKETTMKISNLKDAVLRDIAGMVNNSQLKRLELSLSLRLAVVIADEELKRPIKTPNAEALLAKFFTVKQVEGGSERTLKVYREDLAPLLNGLTSSCSVTVICTDSVGNTASGFSWKPVDS